MRREVLQDSVNRIVQDIRESGIIEMLSQGTEAYQKTNTGDKDSAQWVNVTVLADYFNRTSHYSEVERKISDILQINSIAEPSSWQGQFSKVDPSFIYPSLNRLKQAVDILPRFVALLDRDYNIDGPTAGEATTESGMTLQTVILTDEGALMSSPERIIELLSALGQIYAVIAEVEQLPTGSLAVVGMDSGSEKSFDLLGLAKIMSELRETLQWAYNSVVFHRHNVTARNLQIASDTLGVVEKIAKLESSKAVTSEQAARMKHGLFNGLEKFAATGAYIPEMSQNRSSPAVAMRPQPRLLTASPAEIVREANEPMSSEPVADAANSSLESEGGRVKHKAASDENGQFTPEQIAAAIKHLESLPAPVQRTKPRLKRSTLGKNKT
jgi:hypothetical protein